MKNMIKRLLAVSCAAALLLMVSGMSVMAKNTQERSSLLPNIAADGCPENVSADDEEIQLSLSENEIVESCGDLPEESLGTEAVSQWTVGDNVTLKKVPSGYGFSLSFEFSNGTLWSNWQEIAGLDGCRDTIKSISFSEGEGKLYLPEDSSFLFSGFTQIRQLDLSKIDTSNVTNMCGMFSMIPRENVFVDGRMAFDDAASIDVASQLTDLDLSGFDTSNVTNMSAMFFKCKALANINLDGFNTANVADMSYMFGHCGSLTELDLGSFNTSNVTTMSGMFGMTAVYDGFDVIESSLTRINLSSFDTANVTNFQGMFDGCNKLEELDVSRFNTSKARNIMNMFGECSSLSTLDVSGFDTSNAVLMTAMFNGCSSLTELELGNFVTSNAESMAFMFNNCSSLKELDLGSFDTSKVEFMFRMFYHCGSLTKLNLSSFDTSKVEIMFSMFDGCSSLTELDLGSFDTSGNVNMDGVFNNCTGLQSLKTPKKNANNPELPFVMYDSAGKDYSELPTLSQSILLTKTKKKQDISKASIAGVSLSYGYSGKAYTPKMTVKVNGLVLTEDKDYTVRFSNNKNPGIATITLTGKGDYTGTRTKTFEIVDCVSSVVSGRTYQLIPKNNSATAVCSFSGKMVNNTKVYITDRSESEAMKFKAVKNSDGTWKFINAKCELALAVQQNSTEVGKGLVLYDQTTRTAQNWKLSKKSDNSFAIINAVTGYSIAMSDESAVKGTTLSMAETASIGLQRFYIAETSAVSAPFDGTKSVRASKDKNYALNIASSSKEDGANVNLYSYSNANEKKFRIMYSGGGYYRLVNVNSGLCLTVKGNTKTDGTNVIQSKWAAQSGQRWKITNNSDGTVTLTNALGTVLHLNGNKIANSTNVLAKKAATTTAQKWYLQ